MTQTRPLRILYISPGGLEGRGGMGGVARNLTAAFARMPQQVQCRVLDSYADGSALRMPLAFARTFLQVALACMLGKVDAIHLHMSQRSSVIRKLMLLRLAGCFGVPTILHLHGSEFEVFANSLSPRLRKMMVASMRKASAIVVLGEKWRRFLLDGLGLPPQLVHIIPNGVPLPPLPPLKPAHDTCTIIALGLLGPRKGTPDLLKALASPAMQPLNWRAVIAGNGEVERYREEAARLGIGGRVEMPGWVGPAQVQALLAEANIFTLPSHNEGLPVAILEAMAARLPVITTSVGAIAELVLHGETGLIVSPGDSEALANALTQLAQNPELRDRMGEAGRNRVEEGYTIEVIAGKMVELYRKVGST